MAVYKRGQFYYFEFIYNGERHKVSTKQKNRRVAEEMEATYRSNLAKGEVGIKERGVIPMFTQAMKEFLAWSQDHHSAKPLTHKRYLTSSKPLLLHFRDVRLDGIKPEDVEKYKSARLKWKSGRTGRKLRPATVNRELACLKIVFNHFIKNDVVLVNPVSRVKFLAEDNEQLRVLSLEEERFYLAACSQPLHDIAVLMLECGMRVEEACKIKRQNVDIERGYVFIPFGKTKAARRKIPLTKPASNVLRSRLEGQEGDYLFPHRYDTTTPMVKPNKAHTGALKRTGLPKFRLYDLRHTFASRAAMSGVDLVTLAALLGHSRIQMVMRYAHPTQEHQNEAIKKMEAFRAERELLEFPTLASQAIQ